MLFPAQPGPAPMFPPVYQAALGGTAVLHVAGWIGPPLAAFSLYGGLALLLEDGAQRTVLPIGRRGRARSSLEGGIGSQIEQAEREAGVRRQLTAGRPNGRAGQRSGGTGAARDRQVCRFYLPMPRNVLQGGQRKAPC